MKKLEKSHPFYASLLRLYPKAYRQRYGQEILQTTADMLNDVPNRGALLSTQTRLAIDLSLNAGKQQLNYVGGVMQSEMPRYIKLNGLVASIMLIPFAVGLIANSLDGLINNQNLYNSWLWHMPVLAIWVLYLPALALLFSLLTYMVYLLRGADSKKLVWLKRAVDIKYVWPIILPGLVALGILFILIFHDSGHCWVQTPSHLLTHLSQTWKCTISNRSL